MKTQDVKPVNVVRSSHTACHQQILTDPTKYAIYDYHMQESTIHQTVTVYNVSNQVYALN